MEESETKKERDEDLQELQHSSKELQAQVELLQQHLSAAEAQSAGLQQDLHTTRYSPGIRLVFNSCLPVEHPALKSVGASAHAYSLCVWGCCWSHKFVQQW